MTEPHRQHHRTIVRNALLREADRLRLADRIKEIPIERMRALKADADFLRAVAARMTRRQAGKGVAI